MLFFLAGVARFEYVGCAWLCENLSISENSLVFSILICLLEPNKVNILLLVCMVISPSVFVSCQTASLNYPKGLFSLSQEGSSWNSRGYVLNDTVLWFQECLQYGAAQIWREIV